jgi:glycosyltransferase involved in cell wall biosynthesis
LTDLRVLCLDIEGGFGGSSRSLFEILRHMDREPVALEVWCRRDGPVRERYEALGIPCRITAAMPRMNTLPRASRNLFGYIMAARDMLRAHEFRTRLLEAVRGRFDAIHFNHEGLFLLAAWLRRRHGKAQTMHIRTMIPRNLFGRWQCRRLARAHERLAFITENERANFESLAREAAAGDVIYNAVQPPRPGTAPHPAVPRDARFKIAVLSNYAWVRGIDRMVDVAVALAGRGRRDFLFVVAGDMALKGQLPGELGRIARAGGTLADYAASQGVADLFLFLGHVPEPEPVLIACDALAKPTREDNPWGRDILEGLAAAKAVITVGRYDRFVENSITGILLPEYDTGAFADALIRLEGDREAARRLGAAAQRRVATLCDGASRARALLRMWQSAVEARRI